MASFLPCRTDPGATHDFHATVSTNALIALADHNLKRTMPIYKSALFPTTSRLLAIMYTRTFIVLLMLWAQPGYVAEPATTSNLVTVSLDRDLIEFVKTAIWLGSAFLVLYAVIGVTFFGWDVRKARGSIVDTQKELKEQLKHLRGDYKELQELKEKLEELGAKLQETSEDSASKAQPVSDPGEAHTAAAAKRSDIDLIRQVIASSNYEWTTIGRIIKKTGLSRDDILREARAAPDIVIGFGRQTDDHLFRFKKNAR